MMIIIIKKNDVHDNYNFCQVWVEWRGYGDSFLYSNPYKLISFTGYLVTRAS